MGWLGAWALAGLLPLAGQDEAPPPGPGGPPAAEPAGGGTGAGAPPAQPEVAVPLDVPLGVPTAAVAAVSKLGEQVVLGNHRYAIERMFPRWKERMAKRLGGMDKLEQQLEGVAEQMRLQGIHFMAFKPQGAPRVYEVWPGKKTEVVDGQQVEVMVKTKWMVLIPTVTKFRIMLRVDGVDKFRFIESTGFQVAIADKGSDDWYFMDGASLTVADLRSLFPDVPQNIELPPIERREVQ